MAAVPGNEPSLPQTPTTSVPEDDHQLCCPSNFNSSPPPEGFMQKFRLYETRSVYLLLSILSCFGAYMVFFYWVVKVGSLKLFE